MKALCGVEARQCQRTNELSRAQRQPCLAQGISSQLRKSYRLKRILQRVDSSAASSAPALVVGNAESNGSEPSTSQHTISVDKKGLKQKGATRKAKTKMVCTIGPASSSSEVLESLAANGMSVARFNMCHGTHQWHKATMERIQTINKEQGRGIAVMVDTEGSEIHTGELKSTIRTEAGHYIYLTVRNPAPPEIADNPVIAVSYESFTEDVEVGDSIVVDGGMVMLEVVEKAGPDVKAVCVDPGLIMSRANLTFRRGGRIIRGRNTLLPVISAKDWRDIDFAISMNVDFLAISFVKNADVIKNLRSYIQTRAPDKKIELISKIESYDSIPNLDDIIRASDGVMVARGDLGAQLAVEDVPSIQKYVVIRARQLGKSSIVAHQLLQSMIEYPIPTRAEVADVADVVRQRADALMLSGESAMGRFPIKCLGVLRDVALRMEHWGQQEKYGEAALPQIAETLDGRVSEELCASAAMVANKLKTAAIVVYTRRGFMPAFLSRCRPDCAIYAFTDDDEVRRRLGLRWGVESFLMDLSIHPQDNVEATFTLLKSQGFLTVGTLVTVVSDLRSKEQDIVRSVQIRRVT